MGSTLEKILEAEKGSAATGIWQTWQGWGMGRWDIIWERRVRGGGWSRWRRENIRWSEDPMWDEVFLAWWDRDGGRPCGRIIQCSDRAYINAWGGGAGVGCSLGRRSDGRRRGRGGFRINLRNNNWQILGTEC